MPPLPDRVVGVTLIQSGRYVGQWRIRYVQNGRTRDIRRNTEESARSCAEQLAAELASAPSPPKPASSPVVSEMPKTLSDWDDMLSERTAYVLNHPTDEAAQRALKVAVDAANSFRQNRKARKDESEDVENIRKATTDQLVDLIRLINVELDRRRVVTLIPEGQ